MSPQDQSSYTDCVALIYRALEDLGKKPGNWTEDTELAGHIGLTSLQAMELIAALEDELDVTIPINILPDVRTIGDLASKVASIDEDA